MKIRFDPLFKKKKKIKSINVTYNSNHIPYSANTLMFNIDVQCIYRDYCLEKWHVQSEFHFRYVDGIELYTCYFVCLYNKWINAIFLEIENIYLLNKVNPVYIPANYYLLGCFFTLQTFYIGRIHKKIKTQLINIWSVGSINNLLCLNHLCLFIFLFIIFSSEFV